MTDVLFDAVVDAVVHLVSAAILGDSADGTGGLRKT